MTETAYDVAQWATRTTLGRRVFNHNFQLTGSELPGFALIKVTTMQDSENACERVYLWQKKASHGRELVRVSVTELHHWRLAQGELHTQLTHSMRPDIPEQSGTQPVGDVSFAAQAPKSRLVSSLFFTRGNLVLHIASVGDKARDVRAIARALDAMLSTWAVPSAASGHVTRKTLAAREHRPSEVQTLSAAGWLKVIAPDGELSREGESVVYTSASSGKKQVRILAPLPR
ncbi:MAG: hypothetical protein ABW321_09470 [Polyangiales bacterium]